MAEPASNIPNFIILSKKTSPAAVKSPSATSSKKLHEQGSTDSTSDAAALKEALNKIKLLEGDYKSLHDKRLQDVTIFTSNNLLFINDI